MEGGSHLAIEENWCLISWKNKSARGQIKQYYAGHHHHHNPVHRERECRATTSLTRWARGNVLGWTGVGSSIKMDGHFLVCQACVCVCVCVCTGGKLFWRASPDWLHNTQPAEKRSRFVNLFLLFFIYLKISFTFPSLGAVGTSLV
jgi:hypothetical protein